jgi:type II secretion system protein G
MRTICRKGFTLIELLIVIAIIGILSSFLLANFVGVRQRARDGVRKSDLHQIQSALELYRADQAAYPSSLPECGESLVDGETIYMKKMPCDPLDGSKYYYSSSVDNEYSVYTCLENGNDSQLDTPQTNCNSTTQWKYTLQNP